ncbi:MAG: LLM class flavin-dependent oxidoreductase [Acidimicrobiales bacterium]
MDIGIGLPNALVDVQGPRLIEWAVRAERAGFSVLGTIGRIVYHSHEELIAFAAAAGATSRIEMMSTVMVGPRQPVLLAKQSATLSAASDGRFRLGLGIGGRDDDWLALGVNPTRRGARLEALIATCRSVWAGEPPEGAENPVGPRPVNPRIVLGGYTESAWRRAGRLADGFVAGPMPPEAVAHAFGVVRQGADDAGRATPALYAARYFALGDEAQDEADRNAASYLRLRRPGGGRRDPRQHSADTRAGERGRRRPWKGRCRGGRAVADGVGARAGGPPGRGRPHLMRLPAVASPAVASPAVASPAGASPAGASPATPPIASRMLPSIASPSISRK